MKILGKAIAEKYDIEYSFTNDKDEMISHLNNGGEVIVHVGGNREGYNGIFSRRGHYILLLSIENNTVCVLDPYYPEGKFDEEWKREKVKYIKPFAYCNVDVIMEESATCNTKFHLFKRKTVEM